MTTFDFEMFNDTESISWIDLTQNHLKQCPNIKHMSHLRSLLVMNNPLTQINHETFAALSRNTKLIVSQHEICECYVPDGVICSAADDTRQTRARTSPVHVTLTVNVRVPIDGPSRCVH